MEKEKFKFSSYEIKSLIVTIFVLGFILSFTKWGLQAFDAGTGIRNLVMTTIVVALSILVKLIVQKFVALKKGIEIEYSPWPIGLIIGAIFIFITNGSFIFLAVGTISFNIIERLRVGQKFQQLTHGEMGWISGLGPIVNILLAMVFKALSSISGISVFMNDAMLINIWLAVFGILPLPLMTLKSGKDWWEKINSSEGLTLLNATRLGFVFVLAFVITGALALILLPLISAIPVVLFSSLLVLLLYYITYEKNI
jgi:hypothetical protein